MIPSNILFTNNIKSALADFFSKKSFSKICIIVDENSKKHCLSKVIDKDNNNEFIIIEIESGEKNKILDSCVMVWKQLTKYEFDRNSLLINLGGGVICDMGGFIASTFKRGIKFINLPTTLLSQVDASIGGKIGIDFFEYKNHIGLFRNPYQIFISTSFLDTLNDREIKSGFAEIIKHSLIYDNKYFNKIIKFKWNQQNWNQHIKKSIKIKSNIVNEDPKESGIRKILNFGHTIGHGIESCFINSNNYLLHGEAIMIGMICESYISTNKTGLNKLSLKKISNYILDNYNFKKIQKLNITKIIKNITQDKKNKNENIRMSLLKSIGVSTYNITISKNEIEQSLLYFNNLLKK